MSGRPSPRHAIKLAIAYGLYYTGLLRLWQAIVLRRRAVVLMYHRVLTPDERKRSGSHPALVVDRETFEQQMAVLKRRFVVLSLEEFADRLERKMPLPNSSCVITFDDGWRDNYVNALPALAKHGLPSVVFLPVNYIGRDRLFWPEALTHLLLSVVDAVRRSPGRRTRFETLLSPVGLHTVLDLAGDSPRQEVIAIVARQKQIPRPEMEALLAALERELNVRRGDLGATDGFIDWDQAAQMSENGVTFGGHGAEHLLLTQVTPAEQESELRASKAMLDRLNEPVASFSYPNGYFTPEIAERVKASGYRLAFTTSRGFVSCDHDPFAVSRLNVHENVTASTPMFLARVTGIL